MLILSRKKNEEIVIITPTGEEILLCITEIKPGVTKIGLQADQSIQILRGELLNEVGCFSEFEGNESRERLEVLST